MSGFLKRTKTVNPAGGVNPASSPNVSQYGWTSFDAGNVNQIIEYVDLCKGYAQSAKDSADFVSSKFGEIAAFIDYVEAAYEQLRPVLDELTTIYKDVTEKHSEVVTMHKDVRTWSVLAVAAAQSAQDARDETKAEVAKAEASAAASAASAVAAKVSEVGSEDWYNKSKDLYDDLKEGQVYQGTWNPMTNAYPAKPSTNSVWDVSLPSGTASHTFDNKEWRSGDRLLFALATGVFEQLAVGGGVDSVNGKSGAVTLTAADVGAVTDAGFTLKGAIKVGNTPANIQNLMNTNMIRSGGAGSHATVVGNTSGPVYLDTSGIVYVRAEGATEKKVYHEGFKPTAADIGAIGTSGAQTMTGQLNSVKFTATDSYAYVSRRDNSMGLFLGSTDADNRTILGGGPLEAQQGIYLRPKGITTTIGQVILNNAGQMSAPAAPTDNSHLTNKVYVDASVKTVSDKVDAIGPDAINAMPKTGGVFTGPVFGATGVKGAVTLATGASNRFYDGGGTWMHNYAVGNSLVWGTGTDGTSRIMSLGSTGQLTTEGPIYSKTGNVVRGHGDSVQITVEAGETGAPYIATKTDVESALSVAMRFGQTEVSVESGKRMAASNFRVGNDGGLKFSPTGDLAGLTWAIGVDPNTRNFGLHYYSNGAYAGQSWGVSSNGTTTVYGPGLQVSGSINAGNYLSLTSGTNNLIEFHQPGNSATMIYKPVNTADCRISQSNGQGGEASWYANLNTANAHFSGRVVSDYGRGRTWGEAGIARFYGNGITAGEGQLAALAAQWVQVPGRVAYEQGFGFLSDQSGVIGNYGHALWCQDGGSYLQYWIFRNNGGQQSPSGFRIEGDGRMAGKAYDGYEDHFHWMTASLASTSDANLKTVVGDSVKSAIDVVNQFQFKRFVWNEEAGSIYTTRNKKLTDIGLIAQQVEEVDPSLVKTISVGGDAPTETKTLDTAAMLALAMKAIQEQQVQINELKEKLNAYVQ